MTDDESGASSDGSTPSEEDPDPIGDGGDPSRDAQPDDLIAEFAGESGSRSGLLGELYRGEVDRASTWRTRLDQTTNWAVVIAAAILTWAFTSQDNPHYVLIIGMFATTAFLVMEAHRFREYDVWRVRVRHIQENLFAGLLTGESTDSGWASDLASDLRSPSTTISFRRAIGHRLRRTYLALLLILLAAWIMRITVFVSDESWRETASILGLGGEYLVGAIAVFYVIVLLISAWSSREADFREFEQ